MAKGQLIAAFDFSGAAEDEFHDWYDLEHIPERERVLGFLTCRRWIGAQNPKESVALYDLETLAVLQSPAYRAIGGDNLSVWSKRLTARCRRLLRFEGEQILPGEALAPEAGGLLVVGMTPPAAAETAFNAWYDTEHIPALARVPGVLCARRFRSAGGSGPKYVALYHLTGPEVIEGAAWKEAAESTPMPAPIRPQITDRVRLLCRRYQRRV